MIGRIAAGLIVSFWVFMMAALVRTEFFPQPSNLAEVPMEMVLRKIFAHEEDMRLNVFYQGASVGFCRVEIEPVYESAAETDDPSSRGVAPDRAALAGYNVRSELTLTLSLLGAPSRLRLVGDSHFNPAYEIDAFQLQTRIGEGTIEVQGDAQSNRVEVEFELGDLRDHRVFDFAQIRGAGLASAMGLPGLANFSFLGGGGLPTAFATGADPSARAAAAPTRIYLTDLRVGGNALKTYLVESRLDANMWARMWVSQRGEVLKIETSMGLTMLADVLGDQALAVDRPSVGLEDHDSH